MQSDKHKYFMYNKVMFEKIYLKGLNHTLILLDPSSSMSSDTRCETFSIFWILFCTRNSFFNIGSGFKFSITLMRLKDRSRILVDHKYVIFKNLI